MVRSLVIIIAALQLAAPHMSKPTAKSYAKLIQKEAKERRFDPFTMIALVRGESHWNPSLVNRIGCVGLGQVCPQFLWSYCNTGGEHYDKFRCEQKKAELMNGHYNLQLIARSITAWQPGGRSGFTSEMRGTGSRTCFIISLAGVSAWYGVCSASISKRITPSEYTSLRPSSPLSP